MPERFFQTASSHESDRHMQLKTLILALAVLPLTAQAAVNIHRWKTK